MITNERQYKITNAQLKRFEKAIDSFSIKKVTVRLKSKLLAKAELDALRSEQENLAAQLLEYETLKSGKVNSFPASTLEELPVILIKARIARGFSQRKLAELIGIKEQQIQRYEAEKYASANLTRLSQVAKALELNISEIAKFEKESETVNIDDEKLACV